MRRSVDSRVFQWRRSRHRSSCWSLSRSRVGSGQWLQLSPPSSACNSRCWQWSRRGLCGRRLQPTRDQGSTRPPLRLRDPARMADDGTVVLPPHQGEPSQPLQLDLHVAFLPHPPVRVLTVLPVATTLGLAPDRYLVAMQPTSENSSLRGEVVGQRREQARARAGDVIPAVDAEKVSPDDFVAAVDDLQRVAVTNVAAKQLVPLFLTRSCRATSLLPKIRHDRPCFTINAFILVMTEFGLPFYTSRLNA